MNENERLKLIRNLANLSQKEMGEILGITGAAIGKIESNNMSITAENIRKICEHFNISCDFLLFGDNDSENMKKIMEKRQ